TEQLEQDLQTHRLPTVRDLLDNIDRLEFRHSTAVTAYQSANTADSRNGSVAFLCRPLIARLLIPPLPVDDETYRAPQFNTDQLHNMLDSRYCLIHLSAGGSGAAIIEGQEPQQTVVIDADVKAEHKKGGYSQSRFERIRDEQIEQHIETVIQQTGDLLEAGYDRLLLTGNDDMRSHYREKTDHTATPLEADISSIQEETDLEDAFNAAMSFRSRQLAPHEIDNILDS
ncbi:MAG: Vms1/Ankzf1 family peptidyl-tRNA hydrolase, partial [Candidatus Nanohaloarchaea archaeon]|nr:Vms1/Ankzf1 family peptidyl-tRNA hydrolase [Candidatus Nanohaloarchaea archaeon]